nr:MAG TPA: hypothetical protein [Caudoviricetes sp.]
MPPGGYIFFCGGFPSTYVTVYTAHNWSHKPPLTCL